MIEVESQFPSVEAYYEACPEARQSPESDYGVWWKDDDGGNWRVSFVHHTGHFYAVSLGPNMTGDIVIDGRPFLLLKASGDGDGALVIIGQREPIDYETFGAPDPNEEMLHGWAEVCGQQGSLAWIIMAIARGT